MTNMTRTDPHRPSAIDPSAYQFLGAYYTGTDDDMWDAYGTEHSWLMGHRPDLDPDSPRLTAEDIWPQGEGYGHCDHCGQTFAHGALYRYRPTGEVVRFGHICAAETLSLPDRASLVRRRAEKAAKAAKERREVWEQNAAIHDIYRYWHDEGHLDHVPGGFGGFVQDVLAKAKRYPLSDRQVAALVRATEKHQSFHDQPQEERAERVDAPEGRVEFTGRVVKTKWYDSDFGSYIGATMVVEADGGEYIVWLRGTTRFDPEKGQTWKLRATLDRKDFGFAIGKRPHVLETPEGGPDLDAAGEEV